MLLLTTISFLNLLNPKSSHICIGLESRIAELTNKYLTICNYRRFTEKLNDIETNCEFNSNINIILKQSA